MDYRAKKVIVFVFVIFALSFANSGSDLLKSNENLINRLSSEWYKISIVNSSIDEIIDILNDIRSFEILPKDITKITDTALIEFETMIEDNLKQIELVRKDLNSLKTPLVDDIEIVKEMVETTPVEDMFSNIEENDIERLKTLLQLKHRLDKNWNNVDKLILNIAQKMGLDIQIEDNALNEKNEFLRLVNATLGNRTDYYYDLMSSLKDRLAKRTKENRVGLLYKLEIKDVEKILNEGKYKLAEKKLYQILSRYDKTVITDKFYLLLSKAKFLNRKYEELIEFIDTIRSIDGVVYTKILSMKIQAEYKQKMYRKCISDIASLNMANLEPNIVNVIVSILIESNIAIKNNIDYTKFLDYSLKDKPFYINVIHGIARGLFLFDSKPKAIEFIKESLELISDGVITNKISLHQLKLTYAKMLYETGDFEKSRKIFFSLINYHDMFEECSFGIAWCYIKEEQYNKAELILKKLIAQSPNSLKATEALFIMAKRFIGKANNEWNNSLSTEAEIKKYTELKDKLTNKLQNISDSSNIKAYYDAINDIDSYISDFSDDTLNTYQRITYLYDKALKVLNIAITHYESGRYRSNVFNSYQEATLNKLDSIIVAINEGRNISKKSAIGKLAETLQIKEVVEECYTLKVKIHIDRKFWTKKFINNEKIKLSDKINHLKDGTLKEVLRNRVDSLIESQLKLDKYYSSKIIKEANDLLKGSLLNKNRRYLSYHLSELTYEKENEIYRKKYDEYEKNMVLYDSLIREYELAKISEVPKEPDAPKLVHSESIRRYKAIVLDSIDDSVITPACYYSLAWCYNDMGEYDSALSYMKKVATNYKQSKYAAQAWMFIGETSFENAQLVDAVKAYRSVLKYPESKWFNDALYKLAWSEYRLSNPNKAISSFLALVDLGQGEKGKKLLLENESLEYIAISFSESDITGEKGLEKAKLFCKKLGDPSKGSQILAKLANVYMDQGRFKLSKNTYKALLAMYPNGRNNYTIENNFIAVLSKNSSLEETCKLREDYFYKYNRKSKWAQNQTDSNVVYLADSMASYSLYISAVTYHRLALEQNSSKYYNEALKDYRLYINNYPKTDKTQECHYNLAEIYFSQGNYDKAITEYIAISRRYPNGKYKEISAWNAIVASQALLKQESSNNEK